MLKEQAFIASSALATISISMADFFSFKIERNVAFLTHNFFALTIGIMIFYLSIKMLQKDEGNEFVYYLNMLIGLTMILVHFTKFLTMACV